MSAILISTLAIIGISDVIHCGQTGAYSIPGYIGSNSYSGGGGGRTGGGGLGRHSGSRRGHGGDNGMTYGMSNSYGGGSGGSFDGYVKGIGSYGGGGGGTGSSGGGGGGHAIPAAIKTIHSVQIHKLDIPQTPIQGELIEVGASKVPVTLHFRSASSDLKVLSSHQSGQGDVQHTSSDDKPHKLVHRVNKPVIQEIHEIITPYRKIIQEIRPVNEDVQTIVAKGDDSHQISRNNNNGLYGGGGGGGRGRGGKQVVSSDESFAKYGYSFGSSGGSGSRGKGGQQLYGSASGKHSKWDKIVNKFEGQLLL
ncbi:adult-specific cuticular protein ACP-22-like [Oppia nitens]|uniref:adult-specific cuticular protein ACP-22-like n=1 Tax=Oppia nitens TaxID=1686743 RepID=UPI0023DBA48E|nr:adult-specific cuticular protein ACP-22-like [Oppia nitens]